MINWQKKLKTQWSPKNSISPDDVTHGSDKKIWWYCNYGHHWQATILNRLKGSGCPYCSGRLADEHNNLQVSYPQIAAEWNFELNKGICASNVTPQSNKKFWWRCNQNHQWQACVFNRTKHNSGCPFCAGKLATLNNCLLQFPLLVNEWHPKNKLQPHELLPKSHKKIWWLCPKGHEYEATAASRVHMNSGCPFCAWQTSKLELRVYCELKSLFTLVNPRDKTYGFEIDVLLKKEKIAIEIDGWYWHKDKIDADKNKDAKIKSLNLIPIRLRGIPLPLLNPHDIGFKKSENHHKIMDQLIKKLRELTKKEIIYNQSTWINDAEFKNLLPRNS
jgi:hypothetical protein